MAGPGPEHAALVVAAMMVAALACHPRGPEGPSRAELPAPAIEHGPPPAYAGTWIGPELELSFVGPWVLVRPVDDPEAAPIEMRLLVERRQGDAYALRTTLAGAFPATFLRPDDWTMLVEEDQLAIAMGDEPLTNYAAAPERPPLLLGPAMLDRSRLPEHLGSADALVCLEHAADACAALEQGAGPVAGCRELHWADCVIDLRVPAADPVERATEDTAQLLRRHARALAFTRALERSSPEHPDAAAIYMRALAAASETIHALEATGGVPESAAAREILDAIGAG